MRREEPRGIESAMAQIDERLPENIQGDFFVDATCIDCDACRQIAPAVFRDHTGSPASTISRKIPANCIAR